MMPKRPHTTQEYIGVTLKTKPSRVPRCSFDILIGKHHNQSREHIIYYVLTSVKGVFLFQPDINLSKIERTQNRSVNVFNTTCYMRRVQKINQPYALVAQTELTLAEQSCTWSFLASSPFLDRYACSSTGSYTMGFHLRLEPRKLKSECCTKQRIVSAPHSIRLTLVHSPLTLFFVQYIGYAKVPSRYVNLV